MATKVLFKNPETGETKAVKVGWSWVLFLFGTCFGIPFFMRKLYAMGGMMVACNIGGMIFTLVAMSSDNPTLQMIDQSITFAFIGLAVYFGLDGNKLTAKHYLDNGWRIDGTDAAEIAYAKQKWKLA